MKKYSLILMKMAIGLIILLGVLLILSAHEKSFMTIVADDIENISKLSASIIYAEIDNSLTKPIFVGQTIANDLFLKNWLLAESKTGGDSEHKALIQQYLSDYSKRYGYDSVAVTSAKSGIYYYQEGINKVISTSDAHDVWYYDFVKSDELYKLNVDTDEANSNELTVFVDSKIIDSDGTLLGVVGIGIKMSHLQTLLKTYETEYDLKALLINAQGLVQVDSVVENIETANFFDTPETLTLKERFLSNKADMQIFWYPEGNSDHCLISKYVKNLDWYIIIEKDTSQIQQLLTAQINRDLLFIACIIILVLLLISYIFGKYNRMLLRTAALDDVTNLPNIKMFQEIFIRNTRRPACHHGVLFMFDIDHFKDINDQFGHLFGNTILYRLSEIAQASVGNKGLVARWGGDEFVGVIYGSVDEATEIFDQLLHDTTKITELDSVTISIGAIIFSANKNLDSLIRDADIAMYRSKDKGRDQITFFDI